MFLPPLFKNFQNLTCILKFLFITRNGKCKDFFGSFHILLEFPQTALFGNHICWFNYIAFNLSLGTTDDNETWFKN